MMHSTNSRSYFGIGLLIVMMILSQFCYAGWDPTQVDTGDPKQSQAQTKEVISRFLEANSKLKIFLANAYGYAIFPDVKKGGLVLGGAMGEGTLYEKGKAIGIVSLKQMSLGLQFGGQVFSELIFFKDKETIDTFKAGGIKVSAQASAVGGEDNYSSANLDYNDGVAIFTLANTGIMAEAAIGGQHFKFQAFE